MNKTIRTLLIILACVINGMAICFYLLAGFGPDPFTVLADGLAQTIHVGDKLHCCTKKGSRDGTHGLRNLLESWIPSLLICFHSAIVQIIPGLDCTEDLIKVFPEPLH